MFREWFSGANRPVKRRRLSGCWSSHTEHLENRYLLAAVNLVSGTPDGSAEFTWIRHGEPAIQVSDTSGLYLDEEGGFGHGDAYYSGFDVESPYWQSFPHAQLDAFIGNGHSHRYQGAHDVQFRLDVDSASDVFETRAAAGQLSGNLLYQIQATESYETVGMETPLQFQMDAILGASQFSGTGAGVGLDYSISYRIFRIITVDGQPETMILGQEILNGAATVLTGGGLFDRFQRDLNLTTEIGDYIELIIELDGGVTSSAIKSSTIAANVGFQWSLTQPEAPPVELSLNAQYNEISDSDSQSAMAAPLPGSIIVSPDKFGPYLPQVTLNNLFTITVTGPGASSVTEVRWQVGEVSGYASQITGTDNWKFTLNMGQFSGGTHSLSVVAYDGGGNALDTFAGEVQHVSTLDFELQVDPGATDDLMNVEDARFFQGITTNLVFTGTVANLASFYQSLTKVYVGNTAVTPAFTASAQGAPTKFTFSYNAGLLSPGPTGSIGVDVEINQRSITSYGDTKEPLFAVPKPVWVGNAAISYNTTTGEYEFENVKSGFFDYSASIAKTGVKWLDSELKQLDSSAALYAVMNLHAPLQKSSTVDLSSSKLVGHATILGNPVWPETTYTAGDLDFTGTTLDAVTLDLQTLSIRLPERQLGNRTFFNESLSIDVAKKAFPGIPSWLLEIQFDVALLIQGSLSFEAGVMLEVSGTSLEFVQPGTFVQLNADPSATVTATATAKVGKGYIAEGTAVFTATCTLDISARGEFAGPLTSPSAVSLAFSIVMTIDYQVTATATYLTSDEPVTYDTADNGAEDDKLGPYTLVNVNFKKAQKQLKKLNKSLAQKAGK